MFSNVWHCFIHWAHNLSLTALEIYEYLHICTYFQQSVVVFPFWPSWPCSVSVPFVNSSRTLPGGMSLRKQMYNFKLDSAKSLRFCWYLPLKCPFLPVYYLVKLNVHEQDLNIGLFFCIFCRLSTRAAVELRSQMVWSVPQTLWLYHFLGEGLLLKVLWWESVWWGIRERGYTNMLNCLGQI